MVRWVSFPFSLDITSFNASTEEQLDWDEWQWKINIKSSVRTCADYMIDIIQFMEKIASKKKTIG